jgi:hypothetical protein
VVEDASVGNSQFITVEVTDFSGIARVAVGYTWDDGRWRVVDLTRTLGDPDIWTGSVPYTDTLSYFVQAVDGAGNVGVETNKSWYFGKTDAVAPSFIYLPVVLKGH